MVTKKMLKTNRLPSVWFHGIDADKKEEFESAIRNSTVALSSLYTIMELYLDELESREFSEKSFESPAWANLQAFYLGQKKSIHKMMYLIEGVARPNG